MQNKKEQVEWVCLKCAKEKYNDTFEIKHIKDGICEECGKSKPVVNIYDISPF